MKKLFLFSLLMGFLFFLQENTFAQTYTVNSTLDTPDNAVGDGVCDDGNGNCTLRAAIQESNANPGRNTINFNIIELCGLDQEEIACFHAVFNILVDQLDLVD